MKASFRNVFGFVVASLLVAAALVAIHIDSAAAAETRVTSFEELKAAVNKAEPGDVLTIAPGVYELHKLRIFRNGTKEQPITLRAEKPGTVFLKSPTIIAFQVQASYWTFENLDIEGTCKHAGACEHAFQIKGPSIGIIVRGNRMHGFNSMIKGNGEYVRVDKTSKKRVFLFPADVTIENNIFFNPTPRHTRSPVNFVNLDGGRRWIVRGNLIADFAKAGPKGVAFGAYTKGMSRDSIIERNLVICELTHHGGIRVGLSFGGGGTGKRFLDHPIGRIENLNGIMRNNIIMNCPNDVGIYINKGAGTKIYNNTLYNTFGIDVRYVESDAKVYNNIIAGGVRERDSGKAELDDNIVAGTALGAWLPGLARYINHRLEGQDKKHPNYVDKSDVEYWQSLVTKAAQAVASTWIGRGDHRLQALFVDPAHGDFTLREPEDVIDKGIVLPDVTDDFCGLPRNTPPHDLGALEYGPGGVPRCDIPAMIKRIVGGM